MSDHPPLSRDAERLLATIRDLQELGPPTHGHSIHESGLGWTEGLRAVRELRDAGMIDEQGWAR